MTLIAVAALSARWLAEAAAREGFEVIALDLFGDIDTRRAASQWRSIGSAATLRIEPSLLLDALADVARRGDVLGWLPGGGLEGDADLLARGAALLPLLGTAPEDVRRVRDPRIFFDVLDAHRIAHPPVGFDRPAARDGWLVKDMAGCGGWHIASAGSTSAMADRAWPPSAYFQREVRGMPMSATFIANGRDAVVLGCNRMLMQRIDAHPFVFAGVIGPVPLDAPLAQRIDSAVRQLAAVFALRGVCSLDFMLDGEEFLALEINPRAPASMALYGERGGTVAAHVRACLHHELPTRVPDAAFVHGHRFVFAQAALHLGEAAAQQLGAWPGCHDLPAAGTTFARNDPVCSVSAQGANADEVEHRLAQQRDALLAALENQP